MQNLLEQLKKVLAKDERLTSEGELLKNKVIELSIKLDAGLLELLLADKQMKKAFFDEIPSSSLRAQRSNLVVFDKDKFVKFVSNKQFLPDSYTAFKNKIGLTEEGEFIREKKEVVLSWPYKDCVLEGGMTKEDQKRDEIFWNQTLAPDEISRLLDPKVFTNAKRADGKGPASAKATAGKEHKFDKFKTDENGNIKDNLIIKGNNLLALHSLKKRFAGKVKLIYIDPPYNRDADTFYNDSFKHSSWLVFMKNRLQVAHDLLSNDGIIFVQIDSREQAYLKILMDEIFRRENFLSMISIKSKAEGGVGKEDFLMDVTEYILCYSKNPETEFSVPKEEVDFRPEDEQNYKYILEAVDPGVYVRSISGGKVGEIKIFHHKKYKVVSLDKKERTLTRYLDFFENIFRTTNPQGGLMKRVIPQLPTEKGKLISIEYIPSKGKKKGKLTRSYFLNTDLIAWLHDTAKIDDKKIIKFVKKTNFWAENIHQGIAKEGDVTLLSGKKPEKLLQQIIDIGSEKGDLILDYHLGSGTTCAVAHKMGRQYIGIEQLDYGKDDSVVRLKNVINADRSGISKSVGWKGGGDFVYMELAKWNEKWSERINKAKTSKELEKIWNEMKGAAFLSYKVNPEDVDKYKKEFGQLTIEQQKKFLQTDCLDQNHLYINYSEIDDREYEVSPEDKELNKEFYQA